MADDERIKRITELARRVPEWARFRAVEVAWVPQTGSAIVIHEAVSIDADTGDELTWTANPLAITHPRALSALEAALLVLQPNVLPQVSGKPTYKELHAHYRDACRMLAEHRAWVEQLAAGFAARGWAPDARREHDQASYDAGMAAAFAVAAAELRERAKLPVAHAPATSPSFDEALKQAEAALDRAAAGISQRPLVQEGPRSYVAAREEREKGGERE